MSDPLGNSAARVDQWVARAKEKAERYQAMKAAVVQVSVTESSKDGMVTVTVDSAGNVTGLEITDRNKELSGAQVAEAVLATLRRAQSRLPERLGEVMADTIGDDQQTIDTVVGDYRAKFPEPEPEEPAVDDGPPKIGAIEEDTPPPVPPRPVRRPADDPDDDDFGQSFTVRG